MKSQGVINGEKLVIFTEHKDTLLYLRERLSNNGYKVAVIHGGLSKLMNAARHNGISCLLKPKYSLQLMLPAKVSIFNFVDC